VSGRVVVLGSVNVDLVAHTAVLPRAGETLLASGFAQLMGGKGANQCIAAARAGASVVLCGAVGNDAFGDAALADLVREKVDVRRVVRVDEPTGIALVTVEESGENQIVVVAGANLHAPGGSVDWRPGDVAVAVLEVPIVAVERFLSEARAAGPPRS
jgi:ribokinase